MTVYVVSVTSKTNGPPLKFLELLLIDPCVFSLMMRRDIATIDCRATRLYELHDA
jgi:hypothetical protein